MILSDLSDPRVERLLANNRHLHSVIVQTWEHMMVFDRRTQLVYSSSSRNPALRRLAAAAEPFVSWIEPEFRTPFLTHLTLAWGATEASSCEYVVSPENGEQVWLHSRFYYLGDCSEEEGAFVFVFSQDVTERKRSEAALQSLAYNDPLTNLPNRRALLHHYHQTVAFSKRHKLRFGVIYIDVDDFKRVNDRFGHGGGDAFLKHISVNIASCLRESDILARVGGDEFVILVNHIPHMSVLEMVIRRIYGKVEDGFVWDGERIDISLSIGAALYPEHGDSLQELLDNADSALYQAKNKTKNTYLLYEK
jgi:diguanylate cyclase (GGDEF)-like protein